MNIRVTTLMIAALMFAAVTAGCAYSPVIERRANTVEEGAQHLNYIVEPSRPHQAYRRCVAGEWVLEGSTSHNGDRFSGKSSLKCDEVTVREFGKNRPYGDAGAGLTEEKELARRQAILNGS